VPVVPTPEPPLQLAASMRTEFTRIIGLALAVVASLLAFFELLFVSGTMVPITSTFCPTCPRRAVPCS
jgi:hypothetical protein